MSLLDDARQLTEYPPSYESRGHMLCGYCNEDEHAHAPDCPWLAMPKIVAALEASAEVVADAKGQYMYNGENYIVSAEEIRALEVALANDEKAEVLTGPPS